MLDTLGPQLGRNFAPDTPHVTHGRGTQNVIDVLGRKDCQVAHLCQLCRVAEKPSFRDAWRNAQHCIVPVENIYEPDHRSGVAIPTRIQRKDGKPMGIAGLWTSNRRATGEEIYSFTMLTVNADDHELFKHFHRLGEEKRMVVILHEDQYDDWLDAPASRSQEFMRQFPAHLLMATGEPARGKRKKSAANDASEFSDG